MEVYRRQRQTCREGLFANRFQAVTTINLFQAGKDIECSIINLGNCEVIKIVGVIPHGNIYRSAVGVRHFAADDFHLTIHREVGDRRVGIRAYTGHGIIQPCVARIVKLGQVIGFAVDAPSEGAGPSRIAGIVTPALVGNAQYAPAFQSSE